MWSASETVEPAQLSTKAGFPATATHETNVKIASSSRGSCSVSPAKLVVSGLNLKKKSIVQILVGFYTCCTIYDANQI